MSVKSAGEVWFKKNHNDDNKIKEINSPRDRGVKVNKIIDKNIEEHWVIASIEYDEGESLGIRWFWGTSGYPNGRGWATWLVISKEMAQVLSHNSHIADFCKK